jgi:hypothetical protein
MSGVSAARGGKTHSSRCYAKQATTLTSLRAGRAPSVQKRSQRGLIND